MKPYLKLRPVLIFVISISILCGCASQNAINAGLDMTAINPACHLLFTPVAQDADEMEETEEDKEEQSALSVALLYLPNRIFDLFDIARFGVNVGPGLGLEAEVTKYAKVVFATDTSVGIGFQSLRHLPVCLRSRAKIGLAFISTPNLNMLDWYTGDYDLKVGLHLLLIGAHVAVDMGEIFDFFSGLVTFDPMEDDFIVN